MSGFAAAVAVVDECCTDTHRAHDDDDDTITDYVARDGSEFEASVGVLILGRCLKGGGDKAHMAPLMMPSPIETGPKMR